MTAPKARTLAELARLIHTLREPLGTFFIDVELLESTQLMTGGQSYVRTLKFQMEKAHAALDETAFILGTGHTRSSQ